MLFKIDVHEFVIEKRKKKVINFSICNKMRNFAAY